MVQDLGLCSNRQTFRVKGIGSRVSGSFQGLLAVPREREQKQLLSILGQCRVETPGIPL